MIQLLNKLKGLKINNVIAGGSNGSIIILEVDSFVLFIYCSWRLCLSKKVIVTSNDNNDAIIGNLTIEIKKLINDEIKNIICNEFNDLIIELKSNKSLFVFSNINVDAATTEYDENWSIADKTNNLVYTVNEKNEIIESKYYE